MKKSTIIIIAALVVVILVEAGLLFTGFTKQTALDRELLIEHNNSSQLSLQLKSLTKDFEILGGENETLSSDLSQMTAEKTAVMEENQTLLEENSKLTSQNEVKAKKIVELTEYNKELNGKFMCDHTISNIDFSSNKSVSDALVDYVMDNKSGSEPVSSHYWNTVWSGDKYAIHTISVISEKDNANYIWKFTAYFRGEAYGKHVNGIFYNDQQCWLYLDK